MVLSGVPKLTKWFQGNKMEAPGLSNDRFWIPKIIKFVSQVTATSGNTIKNDPQKTT